MGGSLLLSENAEDALDGARRSGSAGPYLFDLSPWQVRSPVRAQFPHLESGDDGPDPIGHAESGISVPGRGRHGLVGWGMGPLQEPAV